MRSLLGFQMMVDLARSIGIKCTIVSVVQYNYSCDRLFLHVYSKLLTIAPQSLDAIAHALP